VVEGRGGRGGRGGDDEEDEWNGLIHPVIPYTTRPGTERNKQNTAKQTNTAAALSSGPVLNKSCTPNTPRPADREVAKGSDEATSDATNRPSPLTTSGESVLGTQLYGRALDLDNGWKRPRTQHSRAQDDPGNALGEEEHHPHLAWSAPVVSRFPYRVPPFRRFRLFMSSP
jgi:hypothetical protein